MSDNKLIEGIDNVTLDAAAGAAAGEADRVEVSLGLFANIDFSISILFPSNN